MNILSEGTKGVQGDKTGMRKLASLGNLFFTLWIFTLCSLGMAGYVLYGKVRTLEFENKILKERIEKLDPPTAEDLIRTLERLGD